MFKLFSKSKAPRRQFSCRPGLEQLENRLVPAISLTNGVFSVSSVGAVNDTITVERVMSNNVASIRATLNQETQTQPVSAVTSIQIDAGDGADTVTLKDAFTGIPVKVQGGYGVDTLKGPDHHTFMVGNAIADENVWRIGDTSTLNDNVVFSGFENLTGGVSRDQFLLQTSVYSGNIDGGGGFDLLSGPDNFNTWNVTGQNAGNLNYTDVRNVTIFGHPALMFLPRTVGFSNMENLFGGASADTFRMQNSQIFGAVTGGIYGNGGTDVLDYSAFAVAIKVDLAGHIAAGANNIAGIENVTGGAGNDFIAGDGADNILRGGGGDDILLGRAGSDHLFGDAGRDLLIGGVGMDSLFGGAGEDILIGGTTAHDANEQALRDILGTWRGSTDYADRLARLRTGNGSVSGVKLDTTTVPADAEADSLFGENDGAGADGAKDWFWSFAGDTTSDKVAGEKSNMEA